MENKELTCSFCGKKKDDTNLLIAGLDAHICDRCIEQANGIILEESTHKVLEPIETIFLWATQSKLNYFWMIMLLVRTIPKR